MLRIAILTASDQGAAGTRNDISGHLVGGLSAAAGHEITARALLPDDRQAIAAQIREWCDGDIADAVITTGGTGLGPRDVTPEATRDVAERDVPGIPLALAVAGLKSTPFAVLSRGVAAIRGQTLIVNLPGNPHAVEEGMDVLLPLLPHACHVIREPVEHVTPADSGHASAP